MRTSYALVLLFVASIPRYTEAIQRPGMRVQAIRGGAREEEEEKEPNAIMAALNKLPPGVRVHVVGVSIVTLLAMSGAFEPEQLFSLDMMSTIFRFQFWRPLTAATFLGKPSMSWATTLYLLIKYGCELEQEVGSPAYAKFLVLQCILLVGLGSMIGLPFFANSLVTAIIYAASRLHPMANIQFQFGIKLKYYMLPFGLMVIEMLQAQSVAAVIPHVAGVLTAHFHHFFAVVWPQMQRDLNGPDRPSALKHKAASFVSALDKPGRILSAATSSSRDPPVLDDEDDFVDDEEEDIEEYDDDDDDDGLFDED